MGPCCSHAPAFFRTIHDLRKKVSDIKNDVHHVKTLLEGVLKITDDIRPVTSEIKTLVRFYTKESRGLLREHLQQHMNAEGRERLYHRDFEVYFKHELDAKCHIFVNPSEDLSCRLALKEVLKSVTAILQNYKQHYKSDVVKVQVICSLEEEIFHTYELYIEEEMDSSFLDVSREEELDKSDQQISHQSIRLFCKKQKAVSALENLLTEHFAVFDQIQSNAGDSGRIDLYNARTTTYLSSQANFNYRTSKLSQCSRFLSRKIKVKKFGKLCKEEISFRVSIDLAKAAAKLLKFETIVRADCIKTKTTLEQVRKQRYERTILLSIENLCLRWQTDYRQSPSDISARNSDASVPQNQESLDERSVVSIPHLDAKSAAECNKSTRACPKTWNYDQIYEDLNMVLTPVLNKLSERALESFTRFLDNPTCISSKVASIAKVIDSILTNPVETLVETPDHSWQGMLLEMVAVEFDCVELVGLRKFLKACKESKLTTKEIKAIMQTQAGERASTFAQASSVNVLSRMRQNDQIDSVVDTLSSLIINKSSTSHEYDW